MTKESVLSHVERWQQTQNWLREATREGAHKFVPDGQSPDSWIHKTNIVGLYVWTPVTFQELGTSYQLTRQAIHQKYLETMCRVWFKCSPELQGKYPFRALVLKRPLTEITKLRMSESQGGHTAKVKTLVEEGLSAREIQTRLGISGQQLNNSRFKLKDQVDVPYEVPYEVTPPGEYKRLEAKLSNPNLSDEEVKQELPKVTRYFVNRLSYESRSVTNPIRDLVENLGLTPINPRDGFTALPNVAWAFEKAGIPVHVIPYKMKRGLRKYTSRYYLIWKHHLPRAEKVLQEICVT